MIYLKTIKELLHQMHPEFDYDKSDDFVSDGLIDSIDMQELFALIEEEYNVELSGTDLAPQNFVSYESISELLAAHGIEIE